MFKFLENCGLTGRVKKAVLFASFLMVVFALSDCQKDVVVTEAVPTYANLHDSVKYVGKAACRACHADKFDTFAQHGMGKSFDLATRAKSAASFGNHVLVRDSINDFTYHPFWRNDSLFVSEFRLDSSGDTLHYREQYIKYIVGSGQHTNSHIYEQNGHLYQAPITFFTQKGIWDLAPGFEKGHSSRFDRIISMECMSCHNAMPNFDYESENAFRHVPLGIDCERCHGPGEVHVQRKLAGEVIDTALYTDFSIVNPANLSRDLAESICQRCHLQAVSVLQPDKGYEDFKPGLALSSVMDIYFPEFSGAETDFIMASQAHRMQKSRCYTMSNMTCTTCHDPHVSSLQLPKQHYNTTCQSCHNSTTPDHVVCGADIAKRLTTNNNNCVACHMPTTGTVDIPHVSIHDHYIRKPLDAEAKQAIARFIGLQPATFGEPTAASRAKAYLKYFESYQPHDGYLLDSARFWLTVASKQQTSAATLLELQCHAAYLASDWQLLTELANKHSASSIHDAWTAYRIGEALQQTQHYNKALAYFKRAESMMPKNLKFINKVGAALIEVGDWNMADAAFNKIIAINNQFVPAISNLGFIAVNTGRLTKGEQYYLEALALNPDYVPALLNLAALYLLQQKKTAAKKQLKHLLVLEPNNAAAQKMWSSLQRGR